MSAQKFFKKRLLDGPAEFDAQFSPGPGPGPTKRVKGKHPERAAPVVGQGLLAQYYARIHTLRHYVLSQLPKSSRIRQRKIASVGLALPAPEKPCTNDELALGELLDTTLVAIRYDDDHGARSKTELGQRWEQWIGFSQKGDESYVTLSDGLKASCFSQSELVDFVIWLLFSREKTGSWPRHILCDGFRRQNGSRPPAGPENPAGQIQGLFSAHPNHSVQALKEPPWPQLLALLGKAGERIMIELLVDCAVFRAVKAGKGNLHQLSGIPLSSLETLAANSADQLKPSSKILVKNNEELRPSEISFVRSRMLYARAALNARGLVHFGLRHIHVLNRFSRRDISKTGPSGSLQDDQSTVHVMLYIFPRQFGLHNVFTSAVDRQQTAQRFQDYTLREEEIAKKFPKEAPEEQSSIHVPKRLRGTPKYLVERLQVLHGRCSYANLLQHYCSIPGQAQHGKKAFMNSSKCFQSSSKHASQPARNRKKSRQSTRTLPMPQYTSLTELATPAASISAFCQAVLSKVIPNGFWGQDSIQEHNKHCFLKKVHQFVHLRRFESMCLHELMQGMKMNEIEWLIPPGLRTQKPSQSETRKRAEIFYEFLYYVFDSILIPLIRSNFYVTESNVHRYRLFFFRQDVWRYLAEPAMASLKSKMFEEVRLEDALRVLESRRLGYAQLRLLPKQVTMRPIMNLRRRTMLQGGKRALGPSINTILGPVSSVLKLEKSRNPGRLGSAMFSVGDIYRRIKAFKASLGDGSHQLFFAKVDVQAAFDTIPQDAMVELMKRIPGQSRYKMAKHVEVKTVETSDRPSRRWHSIAKTADDNTRFGDMVEDTLAGNKKDTVFVGSAAQKYHDTKELVALMASHIEQNLVRIGKKYYRQKSGIPQGSVLSSMLCNYFYANLELKHLGFLQTGDCLLLRLIDDFLLITTDKGKARRFVETMHQGLPEYGVEVSLGKSLVNFPLSIDRVEVPISEDGQGFPYCGLLVDCATLDVSKQRDSTKDPVIFNSLTVEFSRSPGQNFKRKALNAFKIQSHLMFFDTAHNSYQAVLSNAYTAFVETATKMWAYARCLPKANRPSPGLLKDTITSLIDVSFRLLTSKSRKLRYPGYSCKVGKVQLSWLAMVACRQVFTRKQTDFREVMAWLGQEIGNMSTQRGLDMQALIQAAKGVGCR